MDDPIKKYFPYDEYRSFQRQNIIDILKAFKTNDNVLYEAPVGAGKSVVGVTVANACKTAYYITAQKILQSQLEKDFSDNFVIVKGRNSYPCWFMNEHMGSNKYYGADRGKCIQKNKSRLKICEGNCGYNNAIDSAMVADKSIFNFSSFLFQKFMANRFKDPKKLLLVDECHGTESQVMQFVDVTIKGEDIDDDVPEFDKVELYVKYFDGIDLVGKMRDAINRNLTTLKSVTGCDDVDEAYERVEELGGEYLEEALDALKEIKRCESIKRRYENFKVYVDKVECVHDYNDNSVTIKPLYASYHAPLMLLNSGKKRLFMSATILNPKIFGESIGLDMSRTAYIQAPSTFPVSNRPIYLDYAGKMDFKNRKNTIPKLIKKINTIMNKHSDERGIIHCQSFWLMDTIMKGVDKKNCERFTSQINFSSKDDMLAHHAVTPKSVIIAPAMHEGLDLVNDLSRFQILAKVPFPDFRNDKQLKVRADRSWSFYLWTTAIKLIQAVGRSVRSETDYAATYIIDESFDKFFHQADSAHLLPDWFVESLVV